MAKEIDESDPMVIEYRRVGAVIDGLSICGKKALYDLAVYAVRTNQEWYERARKSFAANGQPAGRSPFGDMTALVNAVETYFAIDCGEELGAGNG